MGVLDMDGYRRREGTLLQVKLRRRIVGLINGAFATRLFSNYFEDLLESL